MTFYETIKLRRRKAAFRLYFKNNLQEEQAFYSTYPKHRCREWGYLEESAQQLGWDIYTLDPDGVMIKQLLDKGIKGHKGYIEKMPFNDASFDFVIVSEVLEHLNDDQRQIEIREVFRVITQGGWFLGTVPFCENLSLNQVVCLKCGEIFHRWGHKVSFDVKTIHDKLSAYFDVIDIKNQLLLFFEAFQP